MDTFLIDVPMPSMGATVHELTVVSLKIQPGAKVEKAAKLAELESDKSVFEFESPCAGVVREIFARAGDVRASGSPLFRIETADAALRHLESKEGPAAAAEAGGAPVRALVWTPRAAKLAQEAGLDPALISDIEATGPGHRVSGDDVARYLAGKKA